MSRTIWLIGAGALLGIFVCGLLSGFELPLFIALGIGVLFFSEFLVGGLTRLCKSIPEPHSIFARLLVYGCLAGLIMWLVFPLPVSQREQAKKTQCMSNLKQIGFAMLMYSERFDGLNPPASRWMEAIQEEVHQSPYQSSVKTFEGEFPSCPTAKSPETPKAIGYAMSLFSSSKRNTHSEDKPLAFESKQLQRNAAEYFPSFPFRHPHCAGVVLFEDGHVKSVSVPKDS